MEFGGYYFAGFKEYKENKLKGGWSDDFRLGHMKFWGIMILLSFFPNITSDTN
jgi:hypothetical protein